MTRAKKKGGLFSWLFRAYLRFRLRRAFDDLRILGAPSLVSHLEAQPLILACNHVAWWDPLLLIELEHYLSERCDVPADGYCLMDRANLQKFSFFSRLGALGLDRSQARRGYRDLQRSAKVLSRPGTFLVIFPQGRQRPAHLPLRLKAGVSALAAQSRAAVVPIAIRYDFLAGPRPVAHLSAGEPLYYQKELSHSHKYLVSRLQLALSEQLRRIDEAVLNSDVMAVSLLGRQALPKDAPRSLWLKLLNQFHKGTS